MCPVLGDGGDHPRVGLRGVVVHQGELVAVHQERQYHLTEHAGQLWVAGGLREPRLRESNTALLDRKIYLLRSLEKMDVTGVIVREHFCKAISRGALDRIQ